MGHGEAKVWAQHDLPPIKEKTREVVAGSNPRSVLDGRRHALALRVRGEISPGRI